MIQVFRTTPGVLTDDLFIQYGGAVGAATAAQRQACYAIGETMAEIELGTYLVPTTVTGTYSWPFYDEQLRIPLGVTHLISVGSGFTMLDAPSGLIAVDKCTYVSPATAACGTCSSACPEQLSVAFTAGLAAGVAASLPPLLRAITIAAQIMLDDMLEPEKLDGGPGDPSVSRWSEGQYSHQRQGLWQSAFGRSPRANMARQLIDLIRFHPALRM